MQIVVCMKQVPDTTEVKLDKTTGTLIRDGIPSIINPDDKSALELALSLKDQNEDIEVVLLTMGPPQATNALKEGLAMGADSAYLLTDVKFAGADTLATSYTIATTIKDKFNPDIVLCGRQAIDGDTAQVGPQIAEHLGMPQVTYASEIKLENGKLNVTRHFENGHQSLNVTLPCLVTALNDKVKPRYMTPAGIIRVTENADSLIHQLTAADLNIDAEKIGLKGSPTKVKKSITKGTKAAGELIKEDIDTGIAKAVKLIDAMSAL